MFYTILLSFSAFVSSCTCTSNLLQDSERLSFVSLRAGPPPIDCMSRQINSQPSTAIEVALRSILVHKSERLEEEIEKYGCFWWPSHMLSYWISSSLSVIDFGYPLHRRVRQQSSSTEKPTSSFCTRLAAQCRKLHRIDIEDQELK